jgi:hydroxylamine reductase
MFCYQCEQTAKGKGCDKMGVCGKTPEVAGLQDLLIHAMKGLSIAAELARKNGIVDDGVNRFSAEAVFSTLTNVNFDPARFDPMIRRAVVLRDELKGKLKAKGVQVPAGDEIDFEPAVGHDALVAQGESVGIASDPEPNEDIKSLKQTVIYGIKGLCAYADHARILGQWDDAVYEYVHRALAATTTRDKDLGFWVEMALECGRVNVRAMELLDAGNTGTYGHPVPTSVPLGPKAGKASASTPTARCSPATATRN